MISGSGSLGLGRSRARSKSETEASQNVWQPQGDALTGMYNQLPGVMNQTSAMAGEVANLAPEVSGLLSGYASQANDAYGNQLAGGSVGDTGDIRGLLAQSFARQQGGSNTGDMYKSIVGGEGNTYIDPMVNAMKRSGMENLGMMKSRNGLDATAMGQSGSSRHAMENAMATRGMNSDMLDREMMMRGGAYDTDLNMKMDIAKMADTNQLQTQRNMMETLGMSDQNRQAGMGYGTTMQNLGMGMMAPWMQAMNAPWMNMQNYAGVLGDPTVLGKSSSKSGSTASNVNLSSSASGGFM